MVLSNKKLKQKLRTATEDTLIGSECNDELNPDTNSQLKELLHTAQRKPRLSKREKRRKNVSLNVLDSIRKGSNGLVSEENKNKRKAEDKKEDGVVGLVADEENGEKKGKKKKRKRDERGESGGVGSEEKEGTVKEAIRATSTKKKKKKKKTKKQEKKGKEEGEKLESTEEGTTEANKSDGSQVDVDDSTKVYVGGIPYYSTEDDIRSFFEGCGTITEVDCMKFPETGKFRGIAILSFKTEAAAKRALALDGADMGGFYLKIQPYKTTRANKASDFAPERVEGYNRIYLGNLSWDITEDDVRKFFSDCKISSIRFGMDKDTGEFRGYAHVDFSDSLSLSMALKLDQEFVCGRPVKISYAVPLKRANNHPKSVPASNTADKSVPASNNTDKSVPASNNTDKSVPASNTTDDEELKSTSTGKMRRRTCYECGEKGHISTDCPNPKKLTADQTNPTTS
ncbi:protein gar2 [Tripterygium wilfordii]|uniref:Protein gar2 n=1 Tax=Tripterygium wilfordii TaxID=458696 RepID=A0A7J7D8F9_TRIWF|nr:protein gar2 [Tripterygium wilfordii]KAF5742655.1 protein gar2 [Tripterygium wilfordii]